MKVLFIISSLNTGGAQRVLSNVVTNLPDDWEIDILLNSADNITYPYKGRLIDLSFAEPSDRNSILYQLRVLARRFASVIRLKRDGAYDACISFLESANIVNIITGRKYCRTIISAHNRYNQQKSFTNSCLNFLVKLLYNRADSVIAVSEGIKSDLVHNFGIRESIVTAICNGFPIDDIKEKAGHRDNDRNGQPFTFITMGRCEQQKGQWHLIRAFAQFAQKHAQARLVILGEGALFPYLSRLAGDFHLEDKVILKGFIANPYRELLNADVFVFPSLWEGFGNAVLEAMACGLPVISSDYRSGAREILAPGTDIDFELSDGIEPAEYGVITPVCSGARHGFDVPPEAQEQFLLEAMELLYVNADVRERYCAASLKRAEDFSIEKCAKEWVEVIVV